LVERGRRANLVRPPLGWHRPDLNTDTPEELAERLEEAATS
jgi:hypothetical protein